MERKEFMDSDFLLGTEEARILFHDHAEKQPIIDYHCHIDPREIAEDRNYTSIADIWLAGDHYKWRLMRQCGIPEEYITGKADERERFRAWARTLSLAVGSPLYHWSHLELQRYFDCRLPINEKNADRIFDMCGEVLKSGKLSAKKIIKMSDVRVIGTTDDPCDSLEWHAKIKEDDSLGCRVIPTFRPDRLLLAGSDEFPEYVEKLAAASGMRISSFADLKKAVVSRMEFFVSMGCRSSDQSTVMFPCTVMSEEKCAEIFEKALNGGDISEDERKGFVTDIMLFLTKEYARLGWVMQLHFGVVRNT
ncbi:MAG: glucuronate isomerase, partial [Ruminiclostridium sp.]|nr:glucuronate isomerase [Ruminiclostridium sp.]